MGQQLSDTEALLWSLGRDPNLASTMGLVAVLDGRPDLDRLRTTLNNTVATVDRLRQRVVSPSLGDGAFGRPEWVVDEWFDFDHHVRALRPATRGAVGDAELRRTAAAFINDPFDPTRPLWQFLIVPGLARGRTALIGKVHHSISDGVGLLRLAATMLEFEPDAPPPAPIDLDEVFAADIAAEPSLSPGPDHPGGPHGHGDDRSGPGRVLGWLQQAAASVPNPARLVEAGAEMVASARTFSQQLPKTPASELWATRSRNRRLEFHAVPVDSLRTTATGLGVTINDLFVAACAEGAVRYHREVGADLPSMTATVVVNTEPARAGDQLGGDGDNAFIPVAIELPGSSATGEERLSIIGAEVRARRESLRSRAEGLGTISAIGGLMPSSIAAALAVEQAAKVDFATSNIPGTPVPTWLAGQRVRRIHPVGPVAGTAFNITLMTADAEAVLGIHLDPAAVTDPSLLQRSVAAGFRDFGVARR